MLPNSLALIRGLPLLGRKRPSSSPRREFVADGCENVVEHGLRQDARVGVVARAMVAVEKDERMRTNGTARTMGKGEVGDSSLHRAQHRFMRHAPEREN